MILSFRKDDPMVEVPNISLDPPHEILTKKIESYKAGLLPSGKRVSLNLPPVTAACDQNDTEVDTRIFTADPYEIVPLPRDPLSWITLEKGSSISGNEEGLQSMSPTLRDALEFCQASSGESGES